MNLKNPLLLSLILLLCSCSKSENGLKPYSANPYYWQYKGEPVLLLGATGNDNLFQNTNLESHLDSLKNAGGNYIRNTMSDRDQGDERAFAMTSDGKYDLNKWNDAYWKRFENMLNLTSERDIIVQIEIWDQFDHHSTNWLKDPFNPGNNINYTFTEAEVDSVYPREPYVHLQPFFYTVPEVNNNETLLKYQNAFIGKVLSISLKFDNVLYCIDNESNSPEEWATYWTEFIKKQAGDKEIFVTQMWNHWDLKSDDHKRTIDYPERYGYIDISQNSQLPGYVNWENAQYVFNYIKDNPRPVNSTKIYGSETNSSWLTRGITTEHAVQTFFRNITGGFASSRFHRPPSGLGLSETSINCIKTIRKIETLMKMWDITARIDLLSGHENNQVYLAAREGENYMIYFTGPFSAKLDLSNYENNFIIKWISIENAEWGIEEEITGGRLVELNAVDEKGSFALVIKK